MTKPNSFVFQRMTSSAIRETSTPTIAARRRTRRRSRGPRCRRSSWRSTSRSRAPRPRPAGRGRARNRRARPSRTGSRRRARSQSSRRSTSRSRACACASRWWDEQHRLGVLEVGAARHRRARGARRLAPTSAAARSSRPSATIAGAVAQVHPVQGRDLVVAGAAGAQPAAEVGAGPLDQPPLQGGVHVLVVGSGHEGAADGVGLEPSSASSRPASWSAVSRPAACRARA